MATKDISDTLVCAAILAYRNDGLPFADERLHKMTGEHPKVCHAALERACDRGLIECGVSVRSGWLTPKGTEFLREALGVKPDEAMLKQFRLRADPLNGRR